MNKIDHSRNIEGHFAAAWEMAVRTNPMLLTRLKLEALHILRYQIEQKLDGGLSADEIRQTIVEQLFAAASAARVELNEAKSLP
jgi:hypothetical protein